MTTGLGLRIYRDGQPIGFWESGCQALQAADRIIEIVPSITAESDLPLRPGVTNYTAPRRA